MLNSFLTLIIKNKFQFTVQLHLQLCSYLISSAGLADQLTPQVLSIQFPHGRQLKFEHYLKHTPHNVCFLPAWAFTSIQNVFFYFSEYLTFFSSFRIWLPLRLLPAFPVIPVFLLFLEFK